MMLTITNGVLFYRVALTSESVQAPFVLSAIMPSSASDPKVLKLALNPAHRRALAIPFRVIVTYMRTKITQSFNTSLPSEPAPLYQPFPARLYKCVESRRSNMSTMSRSPFGENLSALVLRELKNLTPRISYWH